MSPPKPNFVVTRAKAEDMEEITDLIYDSFSREETALFMGCPDRTTIPKYRQRVLNAMESDKSDVWIQVKDAETGKIAACSNWKIFVNGKPDDKGDQAIDWYEGEEREVSEKVARFMNENRWRVMTGPFVYLHICCTSPEYRRMGAGSLMMQWGVDLADSLFLPGWIEASRDGTALYKAFGFYVAAEVDVHGLPTAHMKRDARSKGIDGTALRKKA
ncbi:hypothetical protein M409DRAFT_19723 [Zasmidium cellare ATCC 36951]|uniref:N-acetyltransferase domain-containing protein n=1 Tax=Zasmidium cellare ATCC 36951 TaxID=1080233 RepID=A0A6A6CS64_ZASCE|nr:uncharacterized protein M409DRAFT_19723 [Zasmidium cellare ATCC 36951]KAF2170117.1 hypothetical protein M409DRAFT_19723 [Zasmidium cellare ATCC 36951]